MWSDPIDELLGWAERILQDDQQLLRIMQGPDRTIFERTVKDAKKQREDETRTGKVGFEATNG